MERIIPTGRTIIQINTPRCCFDYELMCILLNKERVMQRDSDLLYFNSLIKMNGLYLALQTKVYVVLYVLMTERKHGFGKKHILITSILY